MTPAPVQRGLGREGAREEGGVVACDVGEHEADAARGLDLHQDARAEHPQALEALLQAHEAAPPALADRAGGEVDSLPGPAQGHAVLAQERQGRLTGIAVGTGSEGDGEAHRPHEPAGRLNETCRAGRPAGGVRGRIGGLPEPIDSGGDGRGRRGLCPRHRRGRLVESPFRKRATGRPAVGLGQSRAQERRHARQGDPAPVRMTTVALGHQIASLTPDRPPIRPDVPHAAGPPSAIP